MAGVSWINQIRSRSCSLELRVCIKSAMHVDGFYNREITSLEQNEFQKLKAWNEFSKNVIDVQIKITMSIYRA